MVDNKKKTAVSISSAIRYSIRSRRRSNFDQDDTQTLS